MNLRESETVELKSIVIDDIKKELVAFANSDGGTIYIGVADDGSILGVDDTDECILQISNMARDAIKPDITMFTHFEVQEVDGKEIVAVHIQRGSYRPYYLSKKGLRPEGVYVRQGTASVPASDMAIRQMIKETDGDSFEAMRSIKQDLNFKATKEEFKKRAVKFGAAQIKTLYLKSVDDTYTNLGYLLSDECPTSIKAAIFEGNEQTTFKDRSEFSGSVLKQLTEAYSFINQYNRTHSDFKGLYRIDKRDYPEIAVREALLNSIVHRDYSIAASTLIKMYEDRLEIISIGALITGVSLDDILNGVSVCRNPNLADVFYRLELIEGYGTGIQKIMYAYKDELKQPEITVTSNAFKIVLPNINEITQSKSKQYDEETVSEDRSEEDEILQFLKKHETISRKEAEALLDVSQSTAGRKLKALEDKGQIRRFGGSRSVRYALERMK